MPLLFPDPNFHHPAQQARLPSWWWTEQYIVDNYIERTCSPAVPVLGKVPHATAIATRASHSFASRSLVSRIVRTRYSLNTPCIDSPQATRVGLVVGDAAQSLSQFLSLSGRLRVGSGCKPSCYILDSPCSSYTLRLCSPNPPHSHQ